MSSSASNTSPLYPDLSELIPSSSNDDDTIKLSCKKCNYKVLFVQNPEEAFTVFPCSHTFHLSCLPLGASACPHCHPHKVPVIAVPQPEKKAEPPKLFSSAIIQPNTTTNKKISDRKIVKKEESRAWAFTSKLTETATSLYEKFSIGGGLEQCTNPKTLMHKGYPIENFASQKGFTPDDLISAEVNVNDMINYGYTAEDFAEVFGQDITLDHLLRMGLDDKCIKQHSQIFPIKTLAEHYSLTMERLVDSWKFTFRDVVSLHMDINIARALKANVVHFIVSGMKSDRALLQIPFTAFEWMELGLDANFARQLKLSYSELKKAGWPYDALQCLKLKPKSQHKQRGDTSELITCYIPSNKRNR